MIYFLKDGNVWQIILERECKYACTDSKLGPENSHLTCHALLEFELHLNLSSN